MLRLFASTALLIGSGGLAASSQFDHADRIEVRKIAALDPARAARKACRTDIAAGALREVQLTWLAARMPALEGLTPVAGTAPVPGVAASDIGVTGLTGDARRYFDQGIALLYGFNHHAAVVSFRTARELAPDCAICWWGEATANGININAGMSDEQLRAARMAIGRAVALAGRASPPERALIDAAALRFAEGPEADRPSVEQAYARAMLDVAAKFPGSDDIAVLAAESAMNTTPWDYWVEANGRRVARPVIASAIELIDKVRARNPAHPQASHLYIHLVENGPDPRMGEAAADRLVADAPPTLGHLVHMPGHIYFRIGRYRDSIAANIKAVRADEAYLRSAGDNGMYRYGYYPHNVHFLVASAQMAGDMHTVTMETERLKRVLGVEIARELPWVQAIHAAPSFALAQFASDEAVLALTERPSELGYVDAMRHYARAVAHARRGDEAAFADEIQAMEKLAGDATVTAMVGAGFPAPDIIRLAVLVAKGRAAFASGRFAAAADHYRAAQKIEATIPYSEPPYWYFPIAQSLGAALYQAGQYGDARDAFRAALFQAPNSGWALYGLGQSEARLGHRLEARAAMAALEKTWMGSKEWLRMDRL